MNAYNVQIHRTLNLLLLSLTITLLSPVSASMACVVSPDVSVIDSTLAYRTFLIHRVTLLRNMAYKNSEKAQERYKNDHDKRVRFEPCFVAKYYVFVERSPLMTIAADRMA